ncbi:MAG: DUF4418 family protein [Clostridia bacterium]|nr:DUF4418 family protein [Clostridia bacterium]
MKSKLTKILIGIQAAAALCVLGAVKLWAPVCAKMLTLESGSEVHMKCFYTGQAAAAVAVILLAVAIIAFLAKQDHRKIMAISAVGAVVLFLLFTGLIGVCANAEMPCHTTALWGKLCAAVTLLTSLIIMLGGKESQLPD